MHARYAAGREGIDSRTAQACWNGDNKLQSASPSVNTAHMLWWADSHLKHVLDVFCIVYVLCDVNAVA